MSDATCYACRDEPVLMSGGLCPRCAYVLRTSDAASRARAERLERTLGMLLDEGGRDPDERVKRGFRLGIEAAARLVENMGDCAACDHAAEIRDLARGDGRGTAP